MSAAPPPISVCWWRVFRGSAAKGPKSAAYRPTSACRMFIPLVGAAIKKMKPEGGGVLDRMNPGAEPIPAVLVGGGSVLLDGQLAGTSVSLRPDHFGSANAIGAAIAQVSGEVDRVVSLEGTTRGAALEQIVNDARARAVEAGARAESVTLAELEETPLSYLPGNAMRISVKVVGDLAA